MPSRTIRSSHRNKWYFRALEALESRQLLSGIIDINPSTPLPLTAVNQVGQIIADTHQSKEVFYDAVRNELYISSVDGVARYDLTTGQFLTAWPAAPGTTNGRGDLTPDGSSLYLVGGTVGPVLTIEKIDLATGNTQLYSMQTGTDGGVAEDLFFFSGGTADVAMGNTLYRCDFTNQTLIPVYSNPGTWSIYGNASRTMMMGLELPPITRLLESFTVENGASADVTVAPVAATTPNFSQYPAALSPDGSLHAVAYDGQVVIEDLGSQKLASIPTRLTSQDQGYTSANPLQLPFRAGVAFDPVRPLLYLARPRSIEAYHTTTWTLAYSFPVDGPTTSITATTNGQMVIAPDGSKLFVTSEAGVLSIDLANGEYLSADNLVIWNIAKPTTFSLSMKHLDGTVDADYRGTVQFSGTTLGGLPASYTFTDADAGTHAFSYQPGALGDFTVQIRDAATSGGYDLRVTEGKAEMPPLTVNASVNGPTVSVTAQFDLTGLTLVPTGTMTFSVTGAQSRQVYSGQVGADGTVSFSTNLTPGSYVVQAAYAGDINFASGNASSSNIDVTEKSSAAMTVAYAPDPYCALVATFDTGSGPAATGTATVFVGGAASPFAQVALVDGRAVILLKTLRFGTQNIRVEYRGDANYLPQTVNKTVNLVAFLTSADILALYTPEALAAAGSLEALKASFQARIDDTNAILQQAGIPMIVRLAAMMPAGYHDSGNIPLDLQRLGIPGDGFLESAPRLRDSLGADLVVLLVANPTVSGGTTTSGMERHRFPDPAHPNLIDGLYAASIVQAQTDPAAAHMLATSLLRYFVPNGWVRFPPGGPQPTIVEAYQGNADQVGKNTIQLIGRNDGHLQGSVEVATSGRISGWVFDSRQLDASLTVQLQIDGKLWPGIVANLARPDLMAAYGSGAHGFNCLVPALAAGTHTVRVIVTDAAAIPQVIATKTITVMTPLFDEVYYLAHNPDVAAAVAAGKIASAWAHFVTRGQFEGRNPSAYFDASYYLAHNPDVAAAVATRRVASAWAHYLAAGQFEGRRASPAFDEQYYLASNPDVASAVASRALRSGLEHYLLVGQYEGRKPIPS